jgi:hypothetical protein
MKESEEGGEFDELLKAAIAVFGMILGAAIISELIGKI